MARKANIHDTIAEAALALAAREGWRRLSLADIAAEAGVPLADAYAACPTRAHVIAAMLARADRAVLAGGPADAEEPARDRLFDVMMRRFDALRPHRDGVAAVLGDLWRDPATLALVLPHLAVSMAWMIEAAGLSSAGVRGALRVKGLAWIYLQTFRVWLRDDSEDMAATMAALDRHLRQADSRVRRCRLGGCRRHEAASEPAPNAAS